MRWGIVGFGWVASDYMAPGIVAAGGRIVAVCDRSNEARHAAARIGARAYDDLSDLLEEPLDAIYVATPNHSHREIVVRCLEAGIAVLCEKPMAATLADAVAMVEASQRHGARLGTAFDQRFHPAHVAIRRAIDEGAVGTPTALRVVYACWLDRAWSASSSRSDNWRIDTARAGGGAVLDLAPHGLDLAAMLLGEPIVSLSGALQHRIHDYDVEDGGMLVGHTARGTLVGLHVAYNMPETLPRRRLEICGTRGQIVAIDTMGQEAGGRVDLIDAASGDVRPLAFDAKTSPFVGLAHAFTEAARGNPHDFDIGRDVDALSLLLSVCGQAHPKQPLEMYPS